MIYHTGCASWQKATCRLRDVICGGGLRERSRGEAARETSPQMLQMNAEISRATQEKPGVEIMLMYRFTFIMIVEWGLKLYSSSISQRGKQNQAEKCHNTYFLNSMLDFWEKKIWASGRPDEAGKRNTKSNASLTAVIRV